MNNIYDGGWVVSGGGVEKPFWRIKHMYICTYVHTYIQNVELKKAQENGLGRREREVGGLALLPRGGS